MQRIFLLLLFLTTFRAGAQQAVRGKIADTTVGNALSHASVSLLRSTDSVLDVFGRTDAGGAFLLKPSKPGKYLMLVTHPAFADYADEITVNDKTPLDLGTIPMFSRSHLLQEVVIKRKIAAIVVKGDTTEFAADSFKVREGATVEDLLKKLPGLQVDRNGKITAQGETVQKLLVDGEEFFSDDPAVVSKNLQAATIDKVQVFDKKSAAAEFTGIDDGQKIKTINLLLKEDAKKGYFGKLAVGGGTGGYFENQGMLNMFKGKRKFSVYGIAANTGKTGLSWSDRDRFGSGNNFVNDEESGNSYSTYSSDADDPSSGDGRYTGEGLPRAYTGGLHYSNKWNADKQHVAGNYMAAQRMVENESGIFTQFILPDSQYFYRQRVSSFNDMRRQSGNGLWEWKIDSTSTLRATANGAYTTTLSTSTTGAETRAGDGDLVNNSARTLSNNSNKTTADAEISYRKRFAKKGRTFSATFNQNYGNTDGTGYLNALNTFYSDTAAFSTAINQLRTTAWHNSTTKGTLSYTEPLSKKLFLELNYGLTSNRSRSTRLTYAKDAVGEGYHTRNDSLSTDYDFDVLTHNGGTALKLVLKKLTASAGVGVSNARFFQTDLLRDTSMTRTFNNYFPRAVLRYQFSKMRAVSFNYNGATRQPTIEQIRPLRDNTDPLNIEVGNPALRQAFSHRMSLNFNDYKPLSGRWMYLNASFSVTDDAVSRSERIDEVGRRVFQYVNVDGNRSGWLYAGMGGKIGKTDFRYNTNANVNLSRNVSLVNGVENVSHNNSFGPSVGLNWEKEKKVSIGAYVNAFYNSNTSTISAFAVSYWTGDAQLETTVNLPAKIDVHTEVNYLFRQQTAAFDRSNNVVRWDAYVGRKFLKNNALEARVAVFDILNQNRGFERTGDATRIVENNYLAVRRYGMLSLIWNITNQPVKEDDDE